MATQAMDLSVYLQRADTYDSITNFPTRSVDSSWKKIIIGLSPTASVDAILAFACGDLPDGANLYIDGVSLVESNFVISTNEIKGKIGEQNKSIKISDIGNFEETDIEIELPYFDSATGQAGTKRFNPVSLNSSAIQGKGEVLMLFHQQSQQNQEPLLHLSER